MVKTYAHFYFDTLVSLKMGGRGSKLVGKESLQVKGKIVGGGGQQRKFEGEGGARPQAEPGRSVLTCLLPELF